MSTVIIKVAVIIIPQIVTALKMYYLELTLQAWFYYFHLFPNCDCGTQRDNSNFQA